MISFNHFNFNILNLEKSLAFYKEALGLTPVREKEASDGSFKLVYLGDGKSDFTLELTYLTDRKEPYDLGECEFHLAFTTDEFDALYEKHKEMGVVCFENPGMGIYFISDPDGYWIEIVPERWSDGTEHLVRHGESIPVRGRSGGCALHHERI